MLDKLYEAYIDVLAIELGGDTGKFLVRNFIKYQQFVPSVESIRQHEIDFNSQLSVFATEEEARQFVHSMDIPIPVDAYRN